MILEKYSLGVGDRFGCQGEAQLRAFQMAAERGVHVAPVWNKSHREHTLTGTLPPDTRREADEAVRALGWQGPYYVDADHVSLRSVDGFIAPSDFFTIDVAGSIGSPASRNASDTFVRSLANLQGTLSVPGMGSPLRTERSQVEAIAGKYLQAVDDAGRVYRHIASRKDPDSFVTEISLDEADSPQTPAELLFILGAVAQRGIPLQTIAPKFTGSFLKGVDYAGDPACFARELEDDIAIIAFSTRTFGLPPTLKLSIHSGSDKFSLYPLIHEVITRTGAGIHLKTAGTTWLEEVAGLAEAGGEGLTLAKQIYEQAFSRLDELCTPYRAVTRIEKSRLPRQAEVNSWGAEQFAGALRHEASDPRFNPDFRQIMHVAYKVASETGSRFTDLLRSNRKAIGTKVTENIFRRHIRPLFLGGKA